MSLINKISEAELKMFDNYRRDYAIAEACGPIVSVEELLRPWESAKEEFLYNLLGKEFIISKEIRCMKTKEELSMKISDLLHGDIGNSKKFVRAWKDFVYQKFTDLRLDKSNPEFVMYYNMDTLMLDEFLLSNIYTGDTFYVYFPNGDKYKVQKGCKVSKALGKIADGFGIEGFEDFRIAHSQILNEKELKGKMHLSIHPLDYVTMSDNECDWNSCMNWRDGGEYRRGTVEMMNSSYVVVAYLSSSEDMPIRGGKWSNKKWRELFIVSKDFVAGIKGYPYWNRGLEKIALDWIKDLAETNLGYDYTEKVYSCYNPAGCAEFEVEELNKTIEIELTTDAMYNDCYDTCYLYVGKDIKDSIYLCYSGASQCMCCGSTMDSFSSEEMLFCDSCDDAKFCERCGCRVEDDECYEVDGMYFCRYCYDDLPYCPGCDRAVATDIERIYLEKNDKIYQWYYATLCYDCLHYNSYFSYNDLKTYREEGPWGRLITYLPLSIFDLKDKDVVRYIETTFDVDLKKDLRNVDQNVWKIKNEN